MSQSGANENNGGHDDPSRAETRLQSVCRWAPLVASLGVQRTRGTGEGRVRNVVRNAVRQAERITCEYSTPPG